jgi:hypothetical protein
MAVIEASATKTPRAKLDHTRVALLDRIIATLLYRPLMSAVTTC